MITNIPSLDYKTRVNNTYHLITQIGSSIDIFTELDIIPSDILKIKLAFSKSLEKWPNTLNYPLTVEHKTSIDINKENYATLAILPSRTGSTVSKQRATNAQKYLNKTLMTYQGEYYQSHANKSIQELEKILGDETLPEPNFDYEKPIIIKNPLDEIKKLYQDKLNFENKFKKYYI